jgi:hypothetical protein
MSTHATAPSAAETPARLAFYERISQKHLTPMQEALHLFCEARQDA